MGDGVYNSSYAIFPGKIPGCAVVYPQGSQQLLGPPRGSWIKLNSATQYPV